MAVCGVVTIGAAVAIIGGWSTSPWTERLLLGCLVILFAAAGWIVVALAIAGALRAVAFFLAPEQPPGLIRINTILEQAEREASAAESLKPSLRKDESLGTLAAQRVERISAS
jgi:hypothetical protein